MNILFLYLVTFQKVKDNGQAQNRRPDLSYGANYSAKFKNRPIGEHDEYGLQIHR